MKMNRIKLGLLALVFFVTATSVQAQERRIDFAKLPKAAQNFVNSYFSAKEVLYVEEDKDFLEPTNYEVKMTDGSKVKFDAKGVWNKIDCKLKAVPRNLIPDAIKSYVAKRFPNNQIVEISKSKRKIEVELTNGIDLVFNNNGQFVRIDD